MKHLIIISKFLLSLIIPLILIASIGSCQKEAVPNDPEPDQEQVVQCRVLTYQGFDIAGTEVTRFEYYYTDQQLDSILSFNYGVLGAKSIYTYTSPTNREGTNINASSGEIVSRTVETLDEWGNVLKSVLNDKTGAFISEARFTYACE